MSTVGKKEIISKELIYFVLIILILLGLVITVFGEEENMAVCDLDKSVPQALNLSPQAV